MYQAVSPVHLEICGDFSAYLYTEKSLIPSVIISACLLLKVSMEMRRACDVVSCSFKGILATENLWRCVYNAAFFYHGIYTGFLVWWSRLSEYLIIYHEAAACHEFAYVACFACGRLISCLVKKE